MSPSMVSCRPADLTGYNINNANDLDEAHTQPSPYSYAQPSNAGMLSFSLPAEQTPDLLSSSPWSATLEGSQNLQNFADNVSTHSGDAEEFTVTSGQLATGGSRTGRSQAIDKSWTTSKMSKGQPMSRANSNKSCASQMSNFGLRSDASEHGNAPQTTDSMVGMDACLLVDSEACSNSSVFWDNGFALDLGPLVSAPSYPLSALSELHVAPSEMQFGPDASIVGSSSPGSLDCYSSPGSSPDHFRDQPWVCGPLSPPHSSPELQDQSPIITPAKLELNLQDNMSGSTVTFGHRRSSGEGESARDHALYRNATPQDDGLYHCPWEGQASCNHRPEKLKCNYDKFVDSHLKPYRCKAESCEGNRFSSTACLLRHEREAHGLHGHGDKPFLCMYNGCERSLPGSGFPRQWNLRDHMKRVHNDHGTNTEVSPPLSLSRQQPTRSRKRKTDTSSVSQQHPSAARKVVVKTSPPTEPALANHVPARPLLEQWMGHRRAIEDLIHGLDKPEDASNIQHIAEVQQHLATMAKMTTDLFVVKPGPDEPFDTTG